jgi:hypothetical protein
LQKVGMTPNSLRAALAKLQDEPRQRGSMRDSAEDSVQLFWWTLRPSSSRASWMARQTAISSRQRRTS